jgi:hypothetical protein
MFLLVNIVGEPKNYLWVNTEHIEVVQKTSADTAAIRFPQNVWYECADFTASQLVEKLNEWEAYRNG